MDIGDLLDQHGLTVAVAESLTGGDLSSRLARMGGASDWFRGGLVAYASAVKHDVLGVRPGPVVSEHAVLDMADGVARLLSADLTVAVTGVGGPDPQEGLAPGTVWIGARLGEHHAAELHHFPGDPDEVCAATCDAALDLLVATLRRPTLRPPRP